MSAAPIIFAYIYWLFSVQFLLTSAKILALQTRTEAKVYIDIATMINNGLLLRNGFEAAYAIARLNDSVRMNLQLDSVRKFLMTDGIKSRIENCNVKELQKNAAKTAFTLANAAKYIRMEAIYKNTLEASQDIEKGNDDYEFCL